MLGAVVERKRVTVEAPGVVPTGLGRSFGHGREGNEDDRSVHRTFGQLDGPLVLDEGGVVVAFEEGNTSSGVADPRVEAVVAQRPSNLAGSLDERCGSRGVDGQRHGGVGLRDPGGLD